MFISLCCQTFVRNGCAKEAFSILQFASQFQLQLFLKRWYWTLLIDIIGSLVVGNYLFTLRVSTCNETDVTLLALPTHCAARLCLNLINLLRVWSKSGFRHSAYPCHGVFSLSWHQTPNFFTNIFVRFETMNFHHFHNLFNSSLFVRWIKQSNCLKPCSVSEQVRQELRVSLENHFKNQIVNSS